MSIQKTKLKHLQPILELSCDVLFFIEHKDWDTIERLLDSFDVNSCELDIVMWLLTFTIPVRHNINNWYSTRYQFLDECMQQQFPPYFFQHIRMAS